MYVKKQGRKINRYICTHICNNKTLYIDTMFIPIQHIDN